MKIYLTMCILCDKKDFGYAKKDIVCYKILEKCPEDRRKFGCKYVTPYVWYPIFDKVLSGEILFKAEGRCRLRNHEDKVWFDNGYIHTFVNREDAVVNREDAVMLAEHISSYEYCVYECVIPKGTRYIKGIFEVFGTPYKKLYDTYASKNIRFIRKIYERKE